MLHPRVPPLVRSLPEVDTIALWRAEEGIEEMSIRTALGMAVAAPPVTDDVNMDEQPPSRSVTSIIPKLHGGSDANGSKPMIQPLQLPDSMVVNPLQNQPPKSTFAKPPSIPGSPHPSTFAIHENVNASAPSNVVAAITPPEASSATSMSAVAAVSTHALQDEDEEMPTINMDSDSESE